MRLLLVLPLAVVLAGAANAPAGGISDEQCPNVAGENTNTCRPGTVGAPYFVKFTEREGSGCGPGRQTFHFDSGVLPAGLTLSLDGTLSGTPVEVGRFQFYVQMREPQNDPVNCAGKRTEKQFTLRVRTPVSLVPVSTVVPRSEVGVPLRMKLRARGGAGFFAWELVDGRLPTGIRLQQSGAIVGTPRAAGTYRIVVRARDPEARDVTWAGTLTVAARVRFRTLRLPAARVGDAYAATVHSAGGVAPASWTLDRGRLPAGVRLARRAGTLSGVPKRAGSYDVAIEVVDALGVRTTRPFTILVRPARSRPGTRPRAASAPG